MEKLDLIVFYFYILSFCLIYLFFAFVKMAPRRVQMQDAAIMQHETPTTPATEQ